MPVSNGLTLPNTLANGQTTDATLLMANLNVLLSGLNRALLDAGAGNGISASGSRIVNLAAGVAITDAANAGQLGLLLPLTGGTLTGALIGTSASFSGDVAAVTQATADSSAKVATTAFVKANLVPYAPLASPALTGSPTAPTPVPSDNSTKLATTAYTDAAVAVATGGSIGVGQTWQNVSATRAAGTTYTNTTGKPILVNVSLQSYETAGDFSSSITVGGVVISSGFTGGQYTGHASKSVSFIVPATAVYQVNIVGGTFLVWAELR
jgi:hypothetical protein